MDKESNKYIFWMLASFLIAGIIEGYFDFEGIDASTASITHTVLLMFLIWGGAKCMRLKIRLAMWVVILFL